MSDNGESNYIIEEQYQERYKLPCPHIGRPCIKDECCRWRVNMAAMPVPGIVAPPRPVLVAKCQEDWTYDNMAQLSQNVMGVLIGMQQAMGGMRPPRGMGGPGLVPPGL